MEVFSSPFPPNKPACSSFLRTAPGSAGVFTARGSIQYPFSCTMQAPRGIRGFSSAFPVNQSSSTASVTSAASTALNDLRVPAALKTPADILLRWYLLPKKQKQILCFSQARLTKKSSQSRARSMTISVIVDRQSSHACCAPPIPVL